MAELSRVDSLIVGCVDKIAAIVEVGIEKLEAGLFGHSPYAGVPFIADVHATELKG
jgi:hypothetical protein